jgi:nucleoside-diphosphate-sugar epimerase/predicted dehydrogenase
MNGICLVGAGTVADCHGEALRALGRSVVAVVDADAAAAGRLARTRGAVAYASVPAALAAGGFDRAHVLVPPPAHAEVALPLLEAGIHVLVEAPLAGSSADCAALLEAASRGGARLGVNHAFLHHPAFVRLARMVEAEALGRPRFLSCLCSTAASGPLLERLVPGLSQLLALAGPAGEVRALADAAAVTLALQGERLPAQLRLAAGQSFPFWQLTVICDDGVIVADILANRVARHVRTRWPAAVDALASGGIAAGGLLADAAANAARQLGAGLRLTGRPDPSCRGLSASIAAFHAALDRGEAPAPDGADGAALVALAERIAEVAPPPPAPVPLAAASAADAAAADVAVLGGAGFIGTHVVHHLLAAGLRVAVMARHVANLPAGFAAPGVVLHRGDIRDEAALARAIAGAPVVVNLAHGGGTGSFEAVRDAMLGGAEAVARACRAAGVRRLVHVGSIACLYLGPQEAPVTGATPSDPQAESRGDFARAAALTERRLLELHAAEGLPVVILRPGVVVGEGGTPFHPGLGFYHAEQHCMGWNRGHNPLPFVLVEDVAAAVLAALRAERVEGRCYNLVGDVRPNARTFVAALATALHRPLRYHPQWPTWLWLEELGRWMVRHLAGHRAPMPRRRDVLSRGMVASFDCTDAKRDLNWQPEADADRFFARAVRVHAA